MTPTSHRAKRSHVSVNCLDNMTKCLIRGSSRRTSLFWLTVHRAQFLEEEHQGPDHGFYPTWTMVGQESVCVMCLLLGTLESRERGTADTELDFSFPLFLIQSWTSVHEMRISISRVSHNPF